MFGVEWCPHCVSAGPEFDALGSSMTIGDTAVTLQRVNPEKEPQKAKGYSIDGYPTIILETGGKQIKHSGPRTKDGFLQFLQQNLA
jgi:thioredoxin-like negative regulator of GroEL